MEQCIRVWALVCAKDPVWLGTLWGGEMAGNQWD